MKIIAHRGYWKAEGAAQNSVLAIKAAIDSNLAGIEVDIRMSKDGVLFLNHDAFIQRKIIHKTLAKDLATIRLKNGEKMALFEEFLELVKDKPNLSLFLEIKSVDSELYKNEICQKVCQQIEKYQLQNSTSLLSFDLEILEIIGKINPHLKRIFLIEENPPELESLIGKCEGIGWYYLLLLENPDLITKTKKLGFYINIWTVNKQKDFKFFSDFKLDSVTTDFPPLISRINTNS